MSIERERISSVGKLEDGLAEASDWLCRAFGFRERLRIRDHRAQLVFGDGAVIVTGGGKERPVAATPVTHAVHVRARSANSPQAYDSYLDGAPFEVVVGNRAALQSLVADHALPAAAGTTIQWTAVATGGTMPLQLQFWRYDASGGWRMVQDYSAAAVYSWTPGASDVGQPKRLPDAPIVGGQQRFRKAPAGEDPAMVATRRDFESLLNILLTTAPGHFDHHQQIVGGFLRRSLADDRVPCDEIRLRQDVLGKPAGFLINEVSANPADLGALGTCWPQCRRRHEKVSPELHQAPPRRHRHLSAGDDSALLSTSSKWIERVLSVQPAPFAGLIIFPYFCVVTVIQGPWRPS